MASIEKRITQSGQQRWDTIWRVNGKLVTRTFRSAADARSCKQRVEAEEVTGLVRHPKGAETTFAAFATHWLATRLVRGRPLSPATVQGYRKLLARNINPTFGNLRLRRVTPDAVREWYTGLLGAKGQDQAAKSYRLLHAIFETAVQDDRLGRNPCTIRGGGTENAAERPLVEASTVVALAQAIGARLAAFVLLAGFAGLRTGESLGLRRCDIDLLHGTVRVVEEAQRLTGLGRITTDPKSEAGKRTLALPGLVLDALAIQLDNYAQPGPEGVLFTSVRGFPITPREVSEHWTRAVAAVPTAPDGLHPHDLRHHAATLIAHMPGITLKELMARIGHSSMQAALRYQHTSDERDQAIASYLDDVTSGIVTAGATAVGESNVVLSFRDARRQRDS